MIYRWWWAIRNDNRWKLFDNILDAEGFANWDGYVFAVGNNKNVWLSKRKAKEYLKTG